MSLSESIRKYMQLKNMTNKQLSEESGVPLKTVSNIVTGATDNPTLETMKALTNALDCTLDDIAYDVDKPDNGYFYDPESAEIAQELHDRPELKVMFKTSRKAKPDDLRFIQDFIDRIVKEQNPQEEDFSQDPDDYKKK